MQLMHSIVDFGVGDWDGWFYLILGDVGEVNKDANCWKGCETMDYGDPNLA